MRTVSQLKEICPSLGNELKTAFPVAIALPSEPAMKLSDRKAEADLTLSVPWEMTQILPSFPETSQKCGLLRDGFPNASVQAAHNKEKKKKKTTQNASNIDQHRHLVSKTATRSNPTDITITGSHCEVCFLIMYLSIIVYVGTNSGDGYTRQQWRRG